MITDQEKQKQLMAIGVSFAEGKLNEQACPFCGEDTLTLSFTVMRPPFFGVFVVCRSCGKSAHLTLSTKPAGFRDELVLPEYQKLEDEAIRGTGLAHKK